MKHNFFTEKRPHNGLTFEMHSEELKLYIENTNIQNLTEEELKLYNFTKLNLHRSNRAIKTYKASTDLIEAVSKINSEQIWMILTEGWCGDSAQTIPYIYSMTKNNPNIKLRILLRDANLDIMDKYLVNGKSRSIPRLVIFDSDGNELALWGPRPLIAQNLVDELKKEGKDIHSIHEKLHLWYGRDRGKTIEAEFIDLIKSKLISSKLIVNLTFPNIVLGKTTA